MQIKSGINVLLVLIIARGKSPSFIVLIDLILDLIVYFASSSSSPISKEITNRDILLELYREQSKTNAKCVKLIARTKANLSYVHT